LFVSYSKRGFTVIEIFIVLSVLAVVSTVSVSYYMDYAEDAKKTVRITNEKLVNDALVRYYEEHLNYPKYQWKQDSVEDLKNKKNRGLDSALSSYFANKNVSDILQEAADTNGYDIFFRVTEPHKRDSENGNIDNSSEIGKWKAAKNLRIETRDFLVHEIRIAESDSGITTSTFDNLEKFNFPLKADSEPINNSDLGYNTISVAKEFEIQMVCIPSGTFLMGSPNGELGRGQYNERQHQVTISKSLLVSKYEVTRQQYYKVLGVDDPDPAAEGTLPIRGVSWDEASAFCTKLNNEYSRLVPYGYKFTLPTEAQWEYACRAGTTTALNSGENLTVGDENTPCPNLDKVAWYSHNSGNPHRPHPVGSKNYPNAWGLYDMHGNVAEWCLDKRGDWRVDYSPDPVTDPISTTGNEYIIRGGSFQSGTKRNRSASRDGKTPNHSDKYFIGIRVVLVPIDE
jgi:prepilin-type N-terminal cleavage/methylation domain-containing protein